MRDARATDRDAILQLERLVFPDPWSADAIHGELVRPQALPLVIDAHPHDGVPHDGVPRESDILAWATFLTVVDQTELLRIAVAPSARRRGYGRRLLAHAFARLSSVGVTLCHLEVRADNQEAIAFYQRLGFSPIGKRRGYYRDGTDAHLLSRPLAVPSIDC